MTKRNAILASVIIVLALVICMVYVNANGELFASAYAGVEGAEDEYDATREANAAAYGVLTALPPLVAIALAFVTKNVVLSLGAGVFVGVFMLNIPSSSSILQSTGMVVVSFSDTCVRMIANMADSWNAGVIMQCLTIGGMVALIARTGGTQAIAEAISRKAKTVRSATLATWLMGLVVFFDDYANSLIVGPMMRPITDGHRMSREKLSFIVDATAAPVAGIAVISTWIATELSAIRSGYDIIGQSVGEYNMFLETIPFRFYNILMLVFIVLIALTGRDFGAMLTAERRARKTGKVVADGAQIENLDDEAASDIKSRGSVWCAILPVATLIVVAFVALYINGFAAAGFEPGTPFSFDVLREAFGNADSSYALFLAALAGSVVALLMGLFGKNKKFNISDGINVWIKGVKSLVITAIILLLAWTLTSTIKELGTNIVISSFISKNVAYFLLPAIIFIIASIMSFATGTSYGTMGILTPLTIPTAFAVLQTQAIPYSSELYMVANIGAVLAGAIFGDHCSPISDTTIMSSMGAGCDHLDHVRTQMPYALFIAAVSAVFGYLLIGFGVNVYISLAISVAVIFLVLRFFGERPEAEPKLAKAK